MELSRRDAGVSLSMSASAEDCAPDGLWNCQVPSGKPLKSDHKRRALAALLLQYLRTGSNFVKSIATLLQHTGMLGGEALFP